MRNNFGRRVAITIGLVVGGLAVWGMNGRAAEVEGHPPTTELVRTAKLALQSTYAEHAADKAKVEDIYRWSIRVKKAEQAMGRNAAAADHRQRMQELHKKAAALYKAGAHGGSAVNYYSTMYYVAAAETEIEEAKAAERNP